MDARQAEKRATELIASLGHAIPPIDVEAIAASLGVRVERADLGDDVSGVLERRSDQAVIGVTWTPPPTRQRCPIPHELGHFLLHEAGTYIDKGTYARFRDEQSGSGTDREEVEANAFAAALLMPASLIQKEARSHRFDPADDAALNALAVTFAVSSQAMSIRLSNLGLFGEPSS